MDEHVPYRLKKTGIRPADTLPWHELGELILMNLGWRYLKAHNFVTKYIEKRWVEELKPGAWREYEEEMSGLITAAAKRGFGREPPDQDMRVFRGQGAKQRSRHVIDATA